MVKIDNYQINVYFYQTSIILPSNYESAIKWNHAKLKRLAKNESPFLFILTKGWSSIFDKSLIHSTSLEESLVPKQTRLSKQSSRASVKAY